MATEHATTSTAEFEGLPLRDLLVKIEQASRVLSAHLSEQAIPKLDGLQRLAESQTLDERELEDAFAAVLRNEDDTQRKLADLKAMFVAATAKLARVL